MGMDLGDRRMQGGLGGYLAVDSFAVAPRTTFRGMLEVDSLLKILEDLEDLEDFHWRVMGLNLHFSCCALATIGCYVALF